LRFLAGRGSISFVVPCACLCWTGRDLGPLALCPVERGPAPITYLTYNRISYMILGIRVHDVIGHQTLAWGSTTFAQAASPIDLY
jgi:hypothetical protein